MKKYIKKIDQLICKYLGIDRQEVIPDHLIVKKSGIHVISSEPYKRHSHYESWEKFCTTNIRYISQHNKNKLGIALGKAIAKNLVVSFS